MKITSEKIVKLIQDANVLLADTGIKVKEDSADENKHTLLIYGCGKMYKADISNRSGRAYIFRIDETRKVFVADIPVYKKDGATKLTTAVLENIKEL